MSSIDIASEIRSLAARLSSFTSHIGTAADVSLEICDLLLVIDLIDETEDDKLNDWQLEIRALRCRELDECNWEYDMCCYWGHQYCSGCGKHKYPELAKLRCSEAINKTRNITEQEYLSQKPTDKSQQQER